MAKKQSSGILLYRKVSGSIEFFLVHPGGPFWAGKDKGVWSIPKGEWRESEDPFVAATREFEEETGFPFDGKNIVPLTPLVQRSGKIVHAWAAEGDCDASQVRSNLFSLEWPPKSGTVREFPEVDRAAWVDRVAAVEKILPGQAGFIDQVLNLFADYL